MSFTTDAAAETDGPPEDPMRNLAYAFGGPAGKGRIRSEIDDFIVDEQLGFEPTGEGEHVFLQIEKRGEWDFPQEDCLLLAFFLPAGGYATAVLRELIDLD